jgi:hypothetical protein
MSFKPPSYAVQAISSRILPGIESANRSGTLVLKAKCPLCCDYKKRLYIKEYSDHFHVYCHNCGYSNGFQQFINDEFPNEKHSLNEYVIESIREGKAFRRTSPKVIDRLDENDMKLRTYMSDKSFKLSIKQENEAKESCRLMSIDYCENRKIPRKYWKSFRFFFEGKLRGYIGIPMWSEEKKHLLHIQGRLLIQNKNIQDQQKYLFLKDEDCNIVNISKPIYGLWLADPNKTVYVTEGTLDAPAYGDQGVSTCGATISDALIRKVRQKFPNRIWCSDNFWTDKAGSDLTMRLLEMGESCFIIPKSMKSKDGNDLLKELDVDVVPENFIEENTYYGKIGITKLRLQI